jgi:hypothetical protein
MIITREIKIFSDKHRIHALGIYFVGGHFDAPRMLRPAVGTLLDL